MVRNQAFWLIVASCAALGVGTSCASGLPAVVSSTPAEVSIEYERDGSLKEASKLATEECQRYGLAAEFDSVTPAVSEESNVAKYHCVKASVAAGRE